MANNGCIQFANSYLSHAASTVGKHENEGPLRAWFDVHEDDEYFGKDTFEQAESELVRRNLQLLLQKATIKDTDIGAILGGDLVNQCTGTSFGVNGSEVPFLGLYGACSTIAEGLLVGSALVDGGYIPNAVAVASSHFCTAERQYRFPPEYGSQRPPTAQNTVTGAGAFLITSTPTNVRVTDGVIGKIVDGGITDASNMGAAMAPAAADTILRYFDHSGKRLSDFDVIVTGDLGSEGLELVDELLQKCGLDIAPKHLDCGVLIYDAEKQDMHAGGSGCGCLASVLGSYFFTRMQNGELNRILAIGTGALLSASSPLQKLSIPAVAHAVCVERV